MPQLKVTLKEFEHEFVNDYARFGFNSKTDLVSTAIAKLRKELLEEEIRKSSELYQEVYQSDLELQKLTDDAASLCLE